MLIPYYDVTTVLMMESENVRGESKHEENSSEKEKEIMITKNLDLFQDFFYKEMSK